jgi:hypothetical protein
MLHRRQSFARRPSVPTWRQWIDQVLLFQHRGLSLLTPIPYSVVRLSWSGMDLVNRRG